MAFQELAAHQRSLQLLQRSLERGRLGHAYLFSGPALEPLETIARTLAKTLNCLQPVRAGGATVDCCDRCLACKKIDHANHPDVHWVRPESKSRIITVDQMREVMKEIQLRPSESRQKVAVVVAADRLRVEGANAFLKTLEEPPADSVLVLLTTEPQRVLETILSRCLRLGFGDGRARPLAAAQRECLEAFVDLAVREHKSLISRYRLLDVLLRTLTLLKSKIEESLSAQSPVRQYEEAEKTLVERWEDELAAAVEAEYRRQRAELLAVLHWWLRDVWVQTLEGKGPAPQRDGASASPATRPSWAKAERQSSLLRFPELDGSAKVAGRLSPPEALQNLQVVEQLQRWLGSNVQEALALEVGLLKLRL